MAIREPEAVNRRQALHHSPDEPKARLIALRGQGYSIAAASEMVGCSERTGWNWWRRCREVARNQEIPEVMDDWVRIVRRSQGMQHAVLDIVEQYAATAQNDHPGPLAEIGRIVSGKELLKHAVTYNIYAGTGTDKIQKESGPPQQPHTGPLVIILGVDRPVQEAIEGEAREVTGERDDST